MSDDVLTRDRVRIHPGAATQDEAMREAAGDDNGEQHYSVRDHAAVICDAFLKLRGLRPFFQFRDDIGEFGSLAGGQHFGRRIAARNRRAEKYSVHMGRNCAAGSWALFHRERLARKR